MTYDDKWNTYNKRISKKTPPKESKSNCKKLEAICRKQLKVNSIHHEIAETIITKKMVVLWRKQGPL